MKEASFYEKKKNLTVQCHLCNHNCTIQDGGRGICRVRENKEGTLYSLNYGKAISANVDPIEKKPFFHFMPGSRAFSFATVGCNFKCLFCQNWDISQSPKDKSEPIIGENLSPQDLVKLAIDQECESIAYTYTEPTIFYEYGIETMELALKKKLKNVWVTNGYTSKEVLKSLKGKMHAANVDLKAFTEKFYNEICGAKLKPVLENLVLYKKLGIWLEVTTLLIPGENDSASELKEMAKFIKEELGAETPWHVTAFYPAYKMLDKEPTPSDTLLKAREIGLGEGLKYVYTGNIPGLKGESTYCPKCETEIVDRVGFSVKRMDKKGKCKKCGEKIDGVW